MRTSHREMQRRIAKTIDSITDNELFLSPQFSAYLTDIAEAISKRYDRPIKATIVNYHGADAFLAQTDNKSISINIAHHILKSCPDRLQKNNVIMGLLGHELGHVLYTDFVLNERYNKAISEGRFYPKRTFKGINPSVLQQWNDYFSKDDTVAKAVISQTAHELLNILEDVYVEYCMCKRYPGDFTKKIRVKNQYCFGSSLSISKQIQKHIRPLNIMQNILCCQLIYGSYDCSDGYSGKYQVLLKKCMVASETCLLEPDMKKRMYAANYIMLILWDQVVEEIEYARKHGISQPPRVTVSALPNRNSKPVKTSLGKGATAPPTPPTGGPETPPSEGAIAPPADSAQTKAIDSILCEVAASIVKRKLEKELEQALQRDASLFDYGEAHKGMSIQVDRMVDIPASLISRYQDTVPPLLLLSKRLQKQLRDRLKKEAWGQKQHGLLMGRQFEARFAYRLDGKCFSNSKLPKKDLDIAIALLVDESGSMNKPRMQAARNTSIVLHDFCRGLGIPLMVAGSTEYFHSHQVQLFLYADFDSADGKDQYRIMNMQNREHNRDGAVIRFVASRLSSRPEKTKLLIVISDGKPEAYLYIGAEAEEDTRKAVKEYRKKGVLFFAAAIGDDRPAIERIYGEGFLDISDLNQLPKNMVQLVTRYLRK